MPVLESPIPITKLKQLESMLTVFANMDEEHLMKLFRDYLAARNPAEEVKMMMKARKACTTMEAYEARKARKASKACETEEAREARKAAKAREIREVREAREAQIESETRMISECMADLEPSAGRRLPGQTALAVRKFALLIKAEAKVAGGIGKFLMMMHKDTVCNLQASIETGLVYLMNSDEIHNHDWVNFVATIEVMSKIYDPSAKGFPARLSSVQLLELASMMKDVVVWAQSDNPMTYDLDASYVYQSTSFSECLDFVPRNHFHTLFCTRAYTVDQVGPIVMCYLLATGRANKKANPSMESWEWAEFIRRNLDWRGPLGSLCVLDRAAGRDTTEIQKRSDCRYNPRKWSDEHCTEVLKDFDARHEKLREYILKTRSIISPTSSAAWLREEVLKTLDELKKEAYERKKKAEEEKKKKEEEEKQKKQEMNRQREDR